MAISDRQILKCIYVKYLGAVGLDAAWDICIVFLRKVLRLHNDSSVEIFSRIVADFNLSASKLLLTILRIGWKHSFRPC